MAQKLYLAVSSTHVLVEDDNLPETGICGITGIGGVFDSRAKAEEAIAEGVKELCGDGDIPMTEGLNGHKFVYVDKDHIPVNALDAVWAIELNVIELELNKRIGQGELL